MRPVAIRAATPEDAPGLVPLLTILGYPAPAPVIAERIRALREVDPAGSVLLAVREGQILGFATLHITPVLHRPTAVGRITGVAVAADAQDSGIGRLLIAAAERWFIEHGVSRIEVTSGPTHLKAHDFYRHLGYEDQGVRFSKPLVPRSSVA